MFGDNLKRYMRASNMMQIELAKAIGTSQNSVCSWVNNMVQPRQYMVERICKVLDCHPEDLYEDNPVPAELNQLVTICEEMKPESIKKVIDYAKLVRNSENA